MKLSYKPSLLIFTFLFGLIGCQDSSNATEMQANDPQLILRAKVLSHIINLVDWPDDVLAQKSFNYCYLGDSNKDNEIYLSKHIQFHNQVIKITNVASVDTADGLCQTIVIDQKNSKNYDNILKHFEGKQVLLLSESTDFARLGGHVSLFKLKGKYAFTLNLESMEQAGFSVDLSGYPTIIAEPIDDDVE